MVTCWESPAAAFPDAVGEAEALAPVAEPELEPEAEEVGMLEEVGAALEVGAEEAEIASAVALRVPHCSLVAQVAWP